jgi:hypothetical protein
MLSPYLTPAAAWHRDHIRAACGCETPCADCQSEIVSLAQLLEQTRDEVEAQAHAVAGVLSDRLSAQGPLYRAVAAEAESIRRTLRIGRERGRHRAAQRKAAYDALVAQRDRLLDAIQTVFRNEEAFGIETIETLASAHRAVVAEAGLTRALYPEDESESTA